MYANLIIVPSSKNKYHLFNLHRLCHALHHFFSKSSIWKEKIGSRDPVKIRTVTPGSRGAGFSNQIKDLDKNRPREDSAQIAHSAKIEGFYPK